MAKIIAFISRKGGTGKTTNSIHLATMLHSIGHRVVLLETDTNYTLNTLRQMELEEGMEEPFPIVAGKDEDVPELIKEAEKNYSPSFIIVDSAGKTTDKSIRKIALKTDLVIIPTSLSQNDLIVTFQTVEDIKGARTKNNTLTIAVLPNALPSQTGQKRIQMNLEDLDCHILENFVPRKKVIAEFSTLLPEPEYLPLTNEILRLLNT